MTINIDQLLLEIKQQRISLVNHGYEEFQLKTIVFMNGEDYNMLKQDASKLRYIAPDAEFDTLYGYPVVITKEKTFVITGIIS